MTPSEVLLKDSTFTWQGKLYPLNSEAMVQALYLTAPVTIYASDKSAKNIPNQNQLDSYISAMRDAFNQLLSTIEGA